MSLQSFIDIRSEFLEASKDEYEFVQQHALLEQIAPHLVDTKLIDSEDINTAYFYSESEKQKLNGYAINFSGERLQLFVISDDYLNEGDEDVLVSQRVEYENQFKKVIRFVNAAIRGNLDDLQDSEPVKPLVSKLKSLEGLKQIDVIEIFLISLSITVQKSGGEPLPKSIHFSEESKQFNIKENGESLSKELLYIRRVVDLNYLSNCLTSQGRGKPLKVVFKDLIGKDIEVIKAAEEKDFESYLCVLEADILVDLYKRYSSQLLEKNVRSFLQFKGVNRGIKATIKTDPEKFIAFNNGLTITATEAKVHYYKKSWYLSSLDDFQIVNGGQTTASIYFSRKEGLDVSKVRVVAKINVAKNNKLSELDDLISKISEYSNSQSRVSRVDLKSRSPKLIQLKRLSETVMTPSGKHWFFERAKGEFNTRVRKNSNPNKLKREFPPEKRFTKEVLAKYYCSWGDMPYLVKKGGEKVFRLFMEEIEPEEGPGITVDRDFYERLVAKMILFRGMEKIYGAGKNSIGQLRSAAVPYSIAAIYCVTDANQSEKNFGLERLWRKEGLSDKFSSTLYDLLELMNDLIKKYSLSDDCGEYSKKEELWISIKQSDELISFLNSSQFRAGVAEFLG
ncbi:AIPR family protein [Glaciecola sp. XM2]|uniref:AIPR family protein n=1 Tax=Glaciecola sp. XM2 TaxID=1914931 RepID=UPI001BDF5D9D|nr:AIPR family protein [Glaciecola sp. XM2]MBT1451510.1 AIPR family protein [Glaciecola sp. XM2]